MARRVADIVVVSSMRTHLVPLDILSLLYQYALLSLLLLHLSVQTAELCKHVESAVWALALILVVFQY